MQWNDLFQIISAVILSVGGAAAIIWAVSSFLGKLWANKYLESIKTENQKQLDYYKNQLEISREAISRYYSSQFSLYNHIYQTLYDLKVCADQLWEEANVTNLTNFYNKLNITKDIVQKNSLIIEEEHFIQLNNLFKEFNNFEINKRKIVKIIKDEKMIFDETSEILNRIIADNKEIKEKYDKLLNSIRLNFRRQMLVKTNPSCDSREPNEQLPPFD